MANLLTALAHWWEATFFLWSPNSGVTDAQIQVPYGTPITAPVNGVVIDASRQPWGGQVNILTYVPGIGNQVLSLIHFDSLNVQAGDIVHVGDLLGASGGQTSGGHWPVAPHNPPWSTGPHIGLRLYDPNNFNNMPLDPNQTYTNIQTHGGQLLYNGQPTRLPSTDGGNGGNGGNGGVVPVSSQSGGGSIPIVGVAGLVSGFADWLNSLNPAVWVTTLIANVEHDVLDFSVRAGLVLLGMVLLVVAVIVFFVASPERRQETEQVAKTAVIAAG